MNDTIKKFGYPATLVKDYDHWVVLLRPAQVTLGSLIVAAKSDATDFGDLSADHFTELKSVTTEVSSALQHLVSHQKLNWLMLMMVDPHVHFHLIPRYEGSRNWKEQDFADRAWPGPPVLSDAVKLSDDQITDMAAWVKSGFPD
ncbi:HIT family protein [Parasphingorhabdus litoris]|uniref:HIT family protein n=1 Tax=Parasphingorhabdus litoris TaxID=394733 RepID=UPI001E4C08CD|nr:HIT family protein [Parasphingorhabdus litoris]